MTGDARELQYVCPECRQKLAPGDDALRCTGCGASYPLVDGVPHFVTGDGYWGEIPRDEMAALVDELDRSHWLEALRTSTSARVRGKAPFIADDRRANWIYEVPLDRGSRVLDVGCGMGSVSAALARHVGEVVSLESVALRVEFCHRRFAQDGLDGVQVVRADGLALPFPPASFDAIVLNGVLEWLGHGRGGDTRRVQLTALEQIRSLLRPEGYLIVAIENRFGLGSFRGRIDHNELRYTSFLPRWLADRITRSRRGHPYDTYTYGHGGYLKLLGEAGFDQVRTLLPIWGYNRPFYLVPPERDTSREMTELLSLTGGRRARVPALRRLERRCRFSSTLAEDFLFLARHGTETRRSWMRGFLREHWEAWHRRGDPDDLRLVTMNRAVPSLLVFAGGCPRPEAVVKLAPTPPPDGFSPPVGEGEALRQVAARIPARMRPLVPELLALERLEGHDVAVASYLHGHLTALPAAGPTAPATVREVERLATRSLDWLNDFHAAADVAPVAVTADELGADCRGAGRYLGDGGEALEAAALDLIGRRWPAAGLSLPWLPQHGDYALSNLLEMDGRIGVVDWERYGRIRFPAYDALHCVTYLVLVAMSGRGGWQAREAMAALLGDHPLGLAVRRPLGRRLESLGFDPGELAPLLALYLLAYAREYGVDPGRRGMMGVIAAQLAAVLELAGAGPPGDPS